MTKIKNLVLLFTLFICLTGCEKYFGDKTDISFIEVPEFQAREVAYVPVFPFIDGFIYPTDVLAGFDELIYVVDSGAQSIIAFDESLREIGRMEIPGVRKIVQDRSLDLLAIGTADTFNTTGKSYTLTCIYRISLKSGGNYGIQYAKIKNKIVQPFYFKTNISSNDEDVRFTDIAIIGTNEFYVTRQGNSSSTGSGPDQAVLLFNHADKFITPVAISSSGTLYRDFFKKPIGITTLCQPPQITANNSRSFITTSALADAVLKVNYIEVFESDFGISYEPSQTIVDDLTQAESFLQTPFRFKNPEGITVTGDGTNFIFITDTETDSLYQFTLTGLEGVRPPPGSEETVYIKASFGGTGIGATQFVEPRAVAYMNKIVYVADGGNGRISRFKLTLDFD